MNHPPKPNAVTLQAGGLPPFVVWSRRPLTEAATDMLTTALRMLRQQPITPNINEDKPLCVTVSVL